jgi:UDP-N-acetylmuramoylalanine-D-glutamate ligase
MGKIRLAAALFLANLSRAISKNILRKSGETIPGYVLLRVLSSGLRLLSTDKNIVLVSGTNGKTSTTKALVQSISALGDVTTSASGSNLPRGAATALMKNSPYAVLEIDELHLPQLIREANPKVVVLLNLTRDQLHRMHEVKRVADRWRDAATQATTTTFIIDVDDPFLNYATKDAGLVIRISFGGRRHPDASVCPSCGAYMNWRGGIYDCVCGLTNKNPDQLLPAGSAAYRNATLANIAAQVMGAKPIQVDEKALERSVTKDYAGVTANIRLTKNPASWNEALFGVDSNDVILIVNARQVDGIDTSWLWDVSFASLKGKRVIVTGKRALDIAYRLHVEGVEATVMDSFEKAIKQFPRGSHVSVLAAYTAFFGLVSK